MAEGFPADDGDAFLPEVLDEGVEILVPGDDVEDGFGVARGLGAEVGSDEEIEGVVAGGGGFEQADLGGEFEELFDQGHREGLHVRTKGGDDFGGVAFDGGQVHFVDVVVIEVDVVGGGHRAEGFATNRRKVRPATISYREYGKTSLSLKVV